MTFCLFANSISADVKQSKYFSVLRAVLSRAREIGRGFMLNLSSGLHTAECGSMLGFSTAGPELLKSLYHKPLDEQSGFIY